jgi:hypothetical protein
MALGAVKPGFDGENVLVVIQHHLLRHGNAGLERRIG